MTRPLKELKGFGRVSINAGETKTVGFDLPINLLGFCNQEMAHVVELGESTVMVGNSAEHLPLSTTFEIIGTVTEIGENKAFSCHFFIE